MPIIRNRLNQRIVINLKSGKNVDILAKGTVLVSESELNSPHLQSFLEKGNVVISEKEEASEKEEVPENKEERRSSSIRRR